MKTQTPTRPLRDLVREFNTGQIQLPQFQRDYVWKPRKIRNLLDSLWRGFPIGGFYLWRPTGPAIESKPKAIGPTMQLGPQFVGYLIDGQQRLTSLEAAFGLFTGEDRGGAELRCYLDLAASESDKRRDTRLFVSYGGHRTVAARVDSSDPSLIPLALLFEGQDPSLRRETEDALRAKRWTAKQLDAALARFDQASKMLDQLVPVTTVSDVSDADAVVVFDRLNKGGSALRTGDVRAAELARGPAITVLKRMRQWVSDERPNRLGFGFSFAFRALVVFHRDSAQFTSLRPDWMEAPGPEGQTLQQSWKDAERATSEALRFIDEEMGWCRRALVPSANAIIVLAYALARMDSKTGSSDKELLRRWLCLTALRGVFQGSVETTISRFLRAVKDRKRMSPAQALVDSLKRDWARPIRADELLRPSQLWGSATQVMHAWLVTEGATDWWETGRTIDTLAREGNASTPGGDLTVHHIFARRLLADREEDSDNANRPANFALVSRSTNAQFGDNRPTEVLATLDPTQRKAARVQFFGSAAGDQLEIERYEEFCQWRADRLAEALNQFIGLR